MSRIAHIDDQFAISHQKLKKTEQGSWRGMKVEYRNLLQKHEWMNCMKYVQRQREIAGDDQRSVSNLGRGIIWSFCATLLEEGDVER